MGVFFLFFNVIKINMKVFAVWLANLSPESVSTRVQVVHSPLSFIFEVKVGSRSWFTLNAPGKYVREYSR